MARAEIGRLTRERDALGLIAVDLRDGVEARDAFLSLAGHEIRNPLATIALSVGHLLYRARQRVDAPDWLVPALEALERQTQDFARRSALLDVTLALAGTPQVERTPGCLAEVVRGAARDLALEAERVGSELRLSIAATVPGQWDLTALERIAFHLISNAIKCGAGRPVEVSVFCNDAFATLVVRHHGPADHRPGEYTGMAPDLWIVRQLVVAQGGEIGAGGAPGVGSFFTATLPREIHDVHP